MKENKTRYIIDNVYFSDCPSYRDVRLIQIGRRFCESGEIIPAHPHIKWIELTVVTSGRGTVSTNGVPTVVKSGDIYVSFPCDVHEICADLGEPFDYDFFSFCCDGEVFGEELDAIAEDFHDETRRVIRDEKIAELVKNAIVEVSIKDKPYSDEVLGNIFSLIPIYLIRDFKNTVSGTADVSGAEMLAFRVMSYIDSHIYSIKNVMDIADEFNYNYGYLSGVFKKATGKNLSNYCQHRKMETAKLLLLQKKKKIGEIAEMFGYNLYSFSKAFKKKYGISPREMQKTVLHER